MIDGRKVWKPQECITSNSLFFNNNRLLSMYNKVQPTCQETNQAAWLAGRGCCVVVLPERALQGGPQSCYIPTKMNRDTYCLYSYFTVNRFLSQTAIITTAE